ncbi:MAG: deoxyguanosine kinase [Candidatus Epulonipiscium fishelsonii]|nr:MAG: deoxyguanosine kinase [Epulopiscium sp. AS2M-Bin002]
MIIVGGMIGIGKTTLAKILSEDLKGSLYQEDIANNPIISLVYTATEEEIEKNRYPFLSQLYFLDSKYISLKEALKTKGSIVDRSIYEDWYFAKKNMELGRINNIEMDLYETLLHSRLKDINEKINHQKVLMVHLEASFETIIDRILKRGRSFETSTTLIDYYRFLWDGYDEWLKQHYTADRILTINMDKFDIVENIDDRITVLNIIKSKLED